MIKNLSAVEYLPTAAQINGGMATPPTPLKRCSSLTSASVGVRCNTRGSHNNASALVKPDVNAASLT